MTGRSIARAGLLVALVLAGRSADAQVQTLSGQVTDSKSGASISGAFISVVGTLRSTSSRDDGSYSIGLTAGTHVLRVTKIGYAPAFDTVSIAAGASARQDFALVAAPIGLDQVVVTGTRATDRTVLEAPVPIDVLSSAEIVATGRSETMQVIQMLAPSINFPRPSVNDGTDHIRPATLRGLGPDQTLVLVNGKRRHTTALVHVNQSVG
jgi:iron complex outermembrane receptor protein